MDLEKLEKDRWNFLIKVYKVTNGDRFSHTSMWDLGELIGFEKEYTSKIVDYLIGEKFIETKGFGGIIALTHEGIKKVENLAKPVEKKEEQKKENKINIINVEKMINSTIKQDTKESKKIYVSNLDETKKQGYISGSISILLSIIFGVFAFNNGWDLTGQIITLLSVIFGGLGVGSFIKPESIGQITSQILYNLSKGFEEPKRK